MAFPSGKTHGEHWREARNAAAAAKTHAVQFRANTGSVNAGQIRNLVNGMRGARNALNVVRSVSGIAAYAQSQPGNSALDIVAEFTTMLAAIDGVLAWVQVNAAGNKLGETLNADNTFSDPAFTQAQVAGLMVEVDAVIAAIA